MMTDNMRDDLIRAMLPHILFDGWSNEALAAAAADLAIDRDTVMAVFPHGMGDVIDAFVDLSDREMAAAFDALEDKPQGVGRTIKTLIMIRLTQAHERRDAVVAAVKALTHPRYGAIAPRTLYRTTDLIWRLTGDKSVDFSFYTKRATLSAVYSATLAFWLANPSADLSRVEKFLDRRLRDVAAIPAITAPARKIANAGIRILTRMAGNFAPGHKSG